MTDADAPLLGRAYATAARSVGEFEVLGLVERWRARPRRRIAPRSRSPANSAAAAIAPPLVAELEFSTRNTPAGEPERRRRRAAAGRRFFDAPSFDPAPALMAASSS
jgi:hypothetical protein